MNKLNYSQFTLPITPFVRVEAREIEEVRRINSSGNRFMMKEKDYVGVIGEMTLGTFLKRLEVTYGQPKWNAIGFVDYWIGTKAPKKIDVKTAQATEQTNAETFGIYINESVWKKAQDSGQRVDIYVGALINVGQRVCTLTGFIEKDDLKELIDKAWKLKFEKNYNLRGVGIYQISDINKTYFRIALEHLRPIVDLKRFDI